MVLMEATPTRPQEVVIERDGRDIGCELAFKGMDAELLIGHWEVCTHLRAGDRIRIRGLGRNIVIAHPELPKEPRDVPGETP